MSSLRWEPAPGWGTGVLKELWVGWDSRQTGQREGYGLRRTCRGDHWAELLWPSGPAPTPSAGSPAVADSLEVLWCLRNALYHYRF